MGIIMADVGKRYQKKIGIIAPTYFTNKHKKMFEDAVSEEIEDHLRFCNLISRRHLIDYEFITPINVSCYKLAENLCKSIGSGSIRGLDNLGNIYSYQELKSKKDKNTLYYNRLLESHMRMMDYLASKDMKYTKNVQKIYPDENPLLIIFLDEYNDKHRVIQNTIAYYNSKPIEYGNISCRVLNVRDFMPIKSNPSTK